MTKALTIREMSIEEFRARLKKGIPDIDLDVEIMALEEVKKTQDQHWILGMLRQLRIQRSDHLEGMAWLDQAEDIWHFVHDKAELGKEMTLGDGRTVIRERGKVALWILMGSHSWGEFCQTMLNMPTDEAKFRERVWDEFAVKQGIKKKLLGMARRACLKRAVYFARILREMEDTERLESLHNRLFSREPDTFRELNDWITEQHHQIKGEAAPGKPWLMLDYEEIQRGKKLIGRVYIRMTDEEIDLGELEFFEPGDDLIDAFERGRELVRKRLERKVKDERELLEQIP